MAMFSTGESPFFFYVCGEKIIDEKFIFLFLLLGKRYDVTNDYETCQR